MDTNSDLVADRKFFLGQPGDRIAAGDLDGNTVSDLAIYRNGLWLLDMNSDGIPDRQVGFGTAAHTPLLGDFDGDGLADLVLYDSQSGVWSTDVTRDGAADPKAIPYFRFGGQSGDIPLAGDINGDGRDEPVIYRNGKWLVDYTYDGVADEKFTVAGAPAGTPVLVRWGGDYRSRPGIFVNGAWSLATGDDRAINVQFNYGFVGEQPISGFFNTRNSIFVRPGGTGSGSLDNPRGTIQSAIDAALPGQMIRVAVGTYPENLVAYKKDSIAIVGAGQLGTKLAPPSGDGIIFVLNNDAWIYNMNVSGGGRGIISLGANLNLRYMSTIGVREHGLVANNSGDPEVRGSALDIAFSTFNRAQRGYGVWLQGDTVANIRRSTASNNGTAGDLVAGQENGRGIVASDNSTVVIRKSQIKRNFETGLSGVGNAKVTVIGSGLSYNKYGDGALFDGTATVDISSSSFEQNGLVRDPDDLSAGRNGIEFYIHFTGTAAVRNNIFRDNTGFGIFVASGTSISVMNNLFDNNWAGVGIEGELKTNSGAVIQGNTFQVPTSASYEVGLVAYGPNATVVLGGAQASQKNTFTNYDAYHAIVIWPTTVSGVWEGYPQMNLDPADNIFIDSPDPIWYA